MTWRGQPGVADEPQHELMGAITPDMLDAVRIGGWIDFRRIRGDIRQQHARPPVIDRRRRPFGETPHQPDMIVADFAELAATLGEASGGEA